MHLKWQNQIMFSPVGSNSVLLPVFATVVLFDTILIYFACIFLSSYMHISKHVMVQ